MSLMSRGMAFLSDRETTAAGVTVTYTRANVSATLTAVPGDQQANAVRTGQPPPATTNWMERDYLIAAAALEAAGFDGPPRLGDRITEAIDGEAVVFELTRRPGQGAQPWRWSEADRLTYRVHTARV